MRIPIDLPQSLPSDDHSEHFAVAWKEPRRPQLLSESWRNRGRIVVLNQEIATLESQMRKLAVTLRETAGSEILHDDTPAVSRRALAISVGRMPFTVHDDEPLCEDINDFPPLSGRKVTLRVVGRGCAPHSFEPDEDGVG